MALGPLIDDEIGRGTVRADAQDVEFCDRVSETVTQAEELPFHIAFELSRSKAIARL